MEYRYYRQLYHAEGSLLKKLYYLHESMLLRQYEKKIARRVPILAVSEKDSDCYRAEFGAERITTLPVFLPFDEVKSREGTGCFCLYHGNLSVPENEQAASWLLRKVFYSLPVPLVITGKNPSVRLARLVSRSPHACLIADPSQDEMQDLIAKAQINILPSFNCTGVKLKLLNALYNGRHCVVNDQAVQCTGLEDACHTGPDADALRQLVTKLYKQPFGAEEIVTRKHLLEKKFNTRENVKQLIDCIWREGNAS